MFFYPSKSQCQVSSILIVTKIIQNTETGQEPKGDLLEILTNNIASASLSGFFLYISVGVPRLSSWRSECVFVF